MPFVAVLDACVLVPPALMDLFMRLGLEGVYKPKWSDDIHKEWVRARVEKLGKDPVRQEKTRQLMDLHALDAKVIGYEGLIDGLQLPDRNDRHVLAAAIRCDADAIITNNLKHFPQSILDEYEIDAIHPDIFISNSMDLHPIWACTAIKKLRRSLNDPKLTPEQYIKVLEKNGLSVTAAQLREDFIDLI